MENNTIPQVLAKPFAADGDKNTIPVAATGTNRASLTEGFPPITGKSVKYEGGIPPERADFNGVMNLNSQFYFAFQNGWLPTFSDEVSTAIGGYPLNAVLWYFDGIKLKALKSAKANNTDNFVSDPSVIGTSWEDALTATSEGAAVVAINSFPATLSTNTNCTATVSGSAAFTLPTPTDTTVENVINILLTVSATTTIDWGVNVNSVLGSFAAGKYEIRLRYNNATSNWIGEVLKAEATPSHTKTYVSFNNNYTDATDNISFTPNFTPSYSDTTGYTAFSGVKSLQTSTGNGGNSGFQLTDTNNVLTFDGTFTVSLWVRIGSSARNTYIFKNGTTALQLEGTGTLYLGGQYISSSSTYLTDSMHYVEINRDSNNKIRYFVDGVLQNGNNLTTVSSTVKFSDSTLCFTSSNDVSHYFQDLVITDQAGHTANYDVPTAPFVLTDNSLADYHDVDLSAQISALTTEINNLKGAIMRRMDFANAVEVNINNSSNTYTVPSNGYLQLNYSTAAAAAWKYKLNSKSVYISNVELMPVSKDDVLGIDSTQFTGLFIPEKTN